MCSLLSLADGFTSELCLELDGWVVAVVLKEDAEHCLIQIHKPIPDAMQLNGNCNPWHCQIMPKCQIQEMPSMAGTKAVTTVHSILIKVHHRLCFILYYTSDIVVELNSSCNTLKLNLIPLHLAVTS